MKKVMISIIAVLLSLALAVIAFFIVFNMSCSNKKSDGVTYELSEDGSSYTVTGVSSSKSGNIVISDTYNGLPVYYVAEEAFKGNTSIKSVTVAASVMYIYSGAFKDCTNLTKFVLKSNETYMERDVLEGTPIYNDENNWDGDVFYIGTMLIFAKTTLSGSYTVREGTTSISARAFFECKFVTSVNVSVSVTFIGEMAFWGCGSLADITLPDGITYIGSSVFVETVIYRNFMQSNEDALYIGKYLITVKVEIMGSFTVTEGTLGIAGGAFSNCMWITEIVLPEGLIFIGVSAFAFTNITIIVIPSSVIYIGIGVFSNCSSLVTITVIEGNAYYYSDGNCLIEKSSKTLVSGCKTSVIPSGVKIIAIGAFAGCDGLVSITIPESVTQIGMMAFMGCTSLTTINIPSGVKAISYHAFRGCISLTTVTISNGVVFVGAEAFANCTKLTEVIIPDSVTHIAAGVFINCTVLVSVTISVNVTFIGDYVFEGCVSLIKIIYVGTEVQWKLIIKGEYWDSGAGDFDLEYVGGSGEKSIYGTYKFAYLTAGDDTVKSGESGYSAETLVLVFNENGTFTLTASTPATIIDAGSSLSGTWTLEGNYVLVAENRVLTDVGIINGDMFTLEVYIAGSGTATIGLQYAG